MTEPTAKHREEARELIAPCRHKLDSVDSRLPSLLIAAISELLSSRDTEIREVLERLVVSVINGENCWCPDPFSADSEKHDAACLAARGLWERVQVSVNKEESDVIE